MLARLRRRLALRSCLAFASLLGAALSSAGCQSECEMPKGRVALTLPEQIAPQCARTPNVFGLEGSLEQTPGGFVLHAVDDDYVFPDTQVDAPTGTLVRVFVQCIRFFNSDTGKLVVILNAPALQGKENPIERSGRMWHAIAGGGSVLFTSALPFDYALEEVCREGNDQDGYRRAEAIILIQGSKAVVVKPGEKGEITVEEGEHAGRYEVENVSVVFSDDDFPEDVNLRIRRAD